MMLSNPWHNFTTAVLLLGIGSIALAPNPFDVDYLDLIRRQANLAERRKPVENLAASAEGVPPAVEAIADATAQQFNIPKALILAIAKHETGNFKAVIGGGNAWGLKCVGSHPTCTKTRTTEYTNGTKGSYRLAFESCSDVERCSMILGNTLTRLNTSGQWRDIPAALDAIGVQYATDPAWAAKVKRYL
jgi:hypothetical protein